MSETKLVREIQLELGSRCCCRCGKRKRLSSFHKGDRVDGTGSYCKVCSSEYRRKRYSNNKAVEVARVVKYHKLNREKNNAYMRSYRSKNRSRVGKYQRAYRLANKDRYSHHDHKKSVLRRAITSMGSFTLPEWIQMKRKYSFRCWYCRKKKPLTRDHVVPLCDGGKHSASNIVPACKSCNSRKWRWSAETFLNSIGWPI